MLALLAALPVLTAAVLILLLRQSAVRAGLFSFAVAAAIAYLAPPFALSGERAAGAMAVAVGLTLNISLVLLGGLLLFRVLQAGGGVDTLCRAVERAVPSPGLRTVILVYGVAVFFESAAGFGVSIVVCAPLFMALGLAPRRAALAALLGQCAVPWGGLAVGTVLGGQLIGMPPDRIAELGTVLSIPFVLLCGATALWIVGGRRLLLGHLAELAVGATALLSVAAWASVAIGVEVAGILAGLAVIALGLLRQRLRQRLRQLLRPSAVAATPAADPLGATLLPLGVLIGALLVTRLVPPLRAFFTSHAVLVWPHAGLRLPLLYHPGFWLIAATASAVATLRIRMAALQPAVGAALRQWLLATLAVAGFIAMAQIMFQAGMTGLVAERIAGAAGTAYPWLLPFVGGLGGFLTASTSGANAMLAQLQHMLAGQLRLPADWAMAAQNAAASNATLASPGRVILATIVIGEPGTEAGIMRPALAVVLLGLAGTACLLVLLLP